jgi:hypothetical protein
MAGLAVVGNSHTGALLKAVRWGAAAVPPGLEVCFVQVRARDARIAKTTPAGFVVEEAASWEEPLAGLLEEADHVAVQWDGNQMNARCLISGGEDFDVILPGADGAGRSPVDSLEIVPYAVVEEFSRASLAHRPELARIMELCRSGRPRRLAILGPPPPLPTAAVRERLAAEKFFVQRATQLGVPLEEVPLVQDDVRCRLWQILSNGYRAFAVGHGAVFLESPSAAVDESGLLKEEFWGPTATHANSHYGACYLARVFEWISEEGQDD